MEKIIKKICTRETILYVIFGVLTTLINIVVSTVLVKVFQVEGNLASTIGIIISILFAYFTNRKMVFNSIAETAKEKWKEFFKFILGRSFTMVIEMAGVFLLYTVLGVEYVITKVTITVIVVILNFFISKFFAFKTKKEENEQGSEIDEENNNNYTSI